MFATVFNLPKWLLAAVVFCVVSGHFQLVECKLTGCCSVAVDASAKTPATGNPSSPGDDASHCDCQCHFSVATFDVPRGFVVSRFARQVRMIERSISAPEVPRAEIEYPPKSVCA